MKVGSLFAGIGGFDEGLRQAGMHSVWQVEKEPFCLKVLKTRFPNAQRAEDILTCRGLISSVPASHVRIGRSRDRERDCAASVVRSFTSLRESCTSFDPLGSSSRMFPDYSVPTQDETLRKSSGFSWSSAGMGFNGVCLTASFSESPSAAAVCSLSDVLESHAPQRFFLSAKAAKGILRRAQKRGRTLPTRLQKALEELAARDATTGRISHSGGRTPRPEPCESTTEQPTPSKAVQTDTRQSYWDDTQQTDTLDCSMLAKGQMMPEKRRFACVLTPAESDRATTQPTASRTCAEERETKPIQGKGLESGAMGQVTPLASQSSTESPLYLAATLSTKNEPANSAATREEMMNTMATLTMSVRRLTPTECEVLQGFPKGWTRLPNTTKDGSRKAKTLPGTELLEMPLPCQSSSG
jgi:site-specific DNA-cytosine methylase